MQTSFIQKAILRAFWQEERYDEHAPRPWLRWLLTRVVGMEVIIPRKSERVRLDNERWVAARKEAALRIDPETAQVCSQHGQILDPYGMRDYIPKECDQVGRNYFARSSESDVWVSFDDLPQATCHRLWARMEAGDFRHDSLSRFQPFASASSGMPGRGVDVK